MSSLYVVDGNAVPFSTARVTDVLTGSLNQSVPFNGGCIVNVPDWLTVTGVSGVFTPTTGLIDKKYAALLAKYPGFTQIAYDHLLDADHLNMVGARGQFGSRGTNRIENSESVKSTMYALASTPSTAVVYWELFSSSVPTVSPTTKMVVEYTERSSIDCTVQVSFNNGSTWLAATSGSILTIPALDQGGQFIIQFTASVPQRHLGGWALIY